MLPVEPLGTRAFWKSWMGELGRDSWGFSSSGWAGVSCFVSCFILPVCLLMALSCLHPRGLIASHLSKCAWCLKGVCQICAYS